MNNLILDKIIGTIITVLLSAALGFCISKIKDYASKKKNDKNNEKAQNEALKMLLQNSLTHTYFVYQKIGIIPDYVYKNWLNSLKSYEDLDGDDYIHTLAEKMKKWKIEKTDIIE